MKWKELVLVAGVASLTACGGSGGGDDSSTSSSVSYSGVTSEAEIDEQSAEQISDTAYSAVSAADTLDDSGSDFFAATQVDTDTPALSAGIHALNDVVKTIVGVHTAAPVTLAGAQVSSSESVSGCNGSSATVTYTINDQGTADTADDTFVSGSMSFNNYQPDNGDGTCADFVMDGAISITFDYTGAVMSGMTLVFDYYSFTYSGKTIAYNGSYAYTDGGYTSSGYDTMVMNMDFRDIDGKVYRTREYTAEYDYTDLVTLNGRVYHPDHGYVDISTTTPFSYTGCNYYPANGVLRATGANNGYVEIDAAADSIGCDGYRMGWSPDGSTVDYKERYWD